MDKNQMVKQEPDIESGKTLLKAMDNKKINPSIFIWLYLSESNRWRILISANKYENKNLKKSYNLFIKEFANENSVNKIGLSNITIIPQKSDLLNTLRMAITTDKKSISGIRFTSNIINGIFIDDVYIYRLT